MTVEQLRSEVTSGMDIIERWLERGDGCAVYENVAFDSGDFGHRIYLSFGSAAAQLEMEEPPTRMPDIGGIIGWKYQLKDTVSADGV